MPLHRGRGVALLFLGLLSLATPLRAQQRRSVSVTRRGELQREVEAGEAISLVFRIASEDRAPHQVIPAVELPTAWRLLLPEPAFRLEPNLEDTHLISVAVPATAASGRYVARFVAVIADGRRESDSAVVIVRERRSLIGTVENAPTLALADSSYQVRFRIRNTGNVAMRFLPRVRSSAGFDTKASPDALDIAPASSGDVIVRVDTRRADRTPMRSRVADRVELRTAGADAKSPGAPLAASMVRVYPRSTPSDVPYHVLRSELTLHGSPGASGSGIAELSSKGVLRDGGSTTAELYVRQPVSPRSPFGTRAVTPTAGVVANLPFLSTSDEYTLRLDNPRWRLGLGDQVISTLPLTQGYAHGFGAAASGERGLFRAGAFSLRDRRYDGARSATSVMGGVGNDRASATLTLLSRRWGADTGTTLTMRTAARLPLHSKAELELGVDQGRIGAMGADVRGGSGPVRFALRHASADSQYSSALRGRTTDDASLGIALSKSARALASMHRSSINLSAEEFIPRWTTFDDESWRASLSFRTLTVEGFGRTLSDVASNSVAQRGVRAQASQRYGPLTLSGSAEHSVLRPDSAAGGVGADRYTGRVQLRHRLQWLALSEEHSSNSLLGARLVGPSSVLFLETHLEAGSGTQLEGSFQRRASPERLLDDDAVDLRVRQRLMMGHEVELRARKYLLTTPELYREPELLVSYHVPFGMPVGRNRSVSAVDVIVREAGSGRAISGVLVRVGDRTGITDGDGRASFGDLTPGSYVLDGDLAALGFVPTSARSLPFEVNAEGGERRDVVLTVAKQAQVSAHVQLVPDSATDASGIAMAGVASGARVVVLLAQGPDTLRRLVDADERARFAGLRPGRWTMIVDRTSVPRHHRVIGDSAVLVLAAGDSRDASIRLVPVARAMVVVAEQVLRDGKSPSSAAVAGRASEPSAVIAAVLPRITRTRRVAARPAPPAIEPVLAEPVLAEPEVPHYYVVGNSDRTLEDVAHWVYGDASLWPRIWAANRSEPGLPDRVQRGALLRVPRAGPLTAEELRMAEQRPQFCRESAREGSDGSCR